MPVPYHEPEIIREAALRFITQVEADASFPLLATGTLVLGPSTHYKTWSESLEEQAQAAAIKHHGSGNCDRKTYLLMELARTLIADPLLWCHAGGIQTSTLALDPRHMQSNSASLFGGRAEKARKATPQEVRSIVEELPIIRLDELKGWSVANDHVDYPIHPWACMRVWRFYPDQAERYDEALSGGRRGSTAIVRGISELS